MVISDADADADADVEGDTVNLSEKFYRTSDMCETDAA